MYTRCRETKFSHKLLIVYDALFKILLENIVRCISCDVRFSGSESASNGASCRSNHPRVVIIVSDMPFVHYEVDCSATHGIL
jgi:hypothetical protein